MSEENNAGQDYKSLMEKVRQLQSEVESKAKADDQAKQAVVDLDQLRAAYIVGIDNNNQMVFQLGGQQKDLVTLAGLHFYAGKQIDKIHGDLTMSGDRLVREVGNAVGMLHNKLFVPTEEQAPAEVVSDQEVPSEVPEEPAE